MIKKITDRFWILLKQPLIVNMLIVGSVTILASFLGFFKEILVGSTYGISEFLDTFALAILVPSFIQNVFIGAVSNLFIPNYITESKTSKRLGDFQLLIICMVSSIAAFFVILLLVFNNFFLTTLFAGHTAVYYDLISKQLYVLLPCLFFWAFNSFLSALLEVENKFLITSITRIYGPITTIVFVAFFKDFFGDFVLAFGVLIGSILAFLYLLSNALRLRVIKIRRIKPFILNSNMRIMIKQIPPKVTSGILTGINPFVDQVFAAQLVVGSVAALGYGNKIPAFGVTIAMAALGNVLLPHFSKAVNDNLKNAYRELFKILKYVFVGFLVAVSILIVFSHDIISLIFERGEFDAQDTEVVANIQQLLLLHIPFYMVTRILVKFLTSINKNSFMAWASFINLVLNLALNFVLIQYFGVYGLALSTSLVLITSSMIYFGYTYKQYKLNRVRFEN